MLTLRHGIYFVSTQINVTFIRQRLKLATYVSNYLSLVSSLILFINNFLDMRTYY